MAITKKVLLVDDASFILIRLKQSLEELPNPLIILTAGDYETALSLLEIENPNIVVLDIHLPGKNGIDILKMVKSKSVPIITIMLTNQANDYYKNLCKDLGADYFIDKSSDFEMLPQIIGSHL
jgi:DNA-binding NarL/FixJ family response regulator